MNPHEFHLWGAILALYETQEDVDALRKRIAKEKARKKPSKYERTRLKFLQRRYDELRQ